MNPFICGTIAHDVMKRYGHGSNCENDKPKTEHKRKHHDPISIPFFKTIDDFHIACGVDPEKMKMQRPWKALPKQDVV